MPNWAFNTLNICGDEKAIEDIKNKLCSKDRVFDFESIRPMSKELDLTAGSDENTLFAYCYKNNILMPCRRSEFLSPRFTLSREDVEKRNYTDKDIELGKKYYDNLAKYGFTRLS